MRAAILLVLACVVLARAQGCTPADKVKCDAAAAGCGATCACDLPVCECCIPCIACVTASVADCCDCLFPGWSECGSESLNNTIIAIQTAKKLATATCYYGGAPYSYGACIGGVGSHQICCNDGWHSCYDCDINCCTA